MASIAIFVTMALCVAGSSTAGDQDLQELKSEIWAGFKDTIQEIHEKMDTYDASTDFKEFAKSFSDKHGAGVNQKFQQFEQNHPEADVSPQSLISLSTEQTEKLKTEVSVRSSERASDPASQSASQRANEQTNERTKERTREETDG